MQDNSLTEENKEKIEQAKQLLSNNNEDIGDVDKISEFKKLNRKANAMVILSVLTAIVVVYFDCFLISCLLPCEGERCHSCLISFFLFVPIYFFWTALPLSIATLVFTSSVKKSIAQTADNPIAAKVRNKRRISLYVLLVPIILLATVYIVRFMIH